LLNNLLIETPSLHTITTLTITPPMLIHITNFIATQNNMHHQVQVVPCPAKFSNREHLKEVQARSMPW